MTNQIVIYFTVRLSILQYTFFFFFFFFLQKIQDRSEDERTTTARGLLLKQTIFRYILATTFQSYHASSTLFQRAYPTPWKAMEDLGLLTKEEVKRLRRR